MILPCVLAILLNFACLSSYENNHYDGTPPYFKCSFPTIYDYAPKDTVWVSHLAAYNEPPAYLAFVQTAPDGQAPIWEVIAMGKLDNVEEYRAIYGEFPTITDEQEEELLYELADVPELVEYICDILHVNSLKYMPRSQFLMVITALKKARCIRDDEMF